jgi:hypothetical protein
MTCAAFCSKKPQVTGALCQMAGLTGGPRYAAEGLLVRQVMGEICVEIGVIRGLDARLRLV